MIFTEQTRLVKIEPVHAMESSQIRIVAITNMGDRLFISMVREYTTWKMSLAFVRVRPPRIHGTDNLVCYILCEMFDFISQHYLCHPN